MTRRIRSLASAAVVATALLLVAEHGAAQTSSAKTERPVKSDQPDDLDRYLCKDLMRMSGDDRVIALSALHGYTLGRKGTTKYVPAELSKISDSFIEHCLSNPNDKALPAFSRLAK
jgi:hypothetical protein